MRKYLLRLRRGARGQALVEFALILPMIVVIMMAFWELSRAWNVYQTITRAAREGARVAVVANGIDTAAQIDSVVNEILRSSALTPSNATITHSAGLGAGSGANYTLMIQYPYGFGLLGAAWDLVNSPYYDFTGVTLTRAITMRNE